MKNYSTHDISNLFISEYQSLILLARSMKKLHTYSNVDPEDVLHDVYIDISESNYDNIDITNSIG